MAYYLVLRQTFVDGILREPGEVISSSVTASANLQATDQAAYAGQGFGTKLEWLNQAATYPPTHPTRCG